jgi:hypothetical protein
LLLLDMHFAIFKNLRGEMPCKHPKTCGDCERFCPDNNDFLTSGICLETHKREDCGHVCTINDRKLY